MKKLILGILIAAGAIWAAGKVDLPDYLLAQANKVTMSGDSFNKLVQKRHVLIKALIIDSSKINPQTRSELEKLFNYNRTAGEELKKIFKK